MSKTITRSEYLADPDALSKAALEGTVTVVGDDGQPILHVCRSLPPSAEDLRIASLERELAELREAARVLLLGVFISDMDGRIIVDSDDEVEEAAAEALMKIAALLPAASEPAKEPSE